MSEPAPLFSLVERKLWASPTVRGLAGPPPNARDLFVYLLTCDAQTAFPGCYLLRVGAAAEDLGWPVEDTRTALAEVEAAGLVKYDPVSRVVFIVRKPRRHARGCNPNLLKAWRKALLGLPACALRDEAMAAAVEAVRVAGHDEGRSPANVAALVAVLTGGDPGPEGLPQGLPQALAKGYPNPLATKDQQKDQERDPRQPDLVTGTKGSAEPAPPPACAVEREREIQAIAKAIEPNTKVCERAGGARALAELLSLAVMERRPGVDVADVARCACLQIAGELAGQNVRAANLANLARAAFVRLYRDPAAYAVARGDAPGPRKGTAREPAALDAGAVVADIRRTLTAHARGGGAVLDRAPSRGGVVSLADALGAVRPTGTGAAR